jgi:hypothetical protein
MVRWAEEKGVVMCALAGLSLAARQTFLGTFCSCYARLPTIGRDKRRIRCLRQTPRKQTSL